MLDTKILIILRNKLRNNNFKNKLFKSDNDKDLQTLIAYEELAIGVDELKKLTSIGKTVILVTHNEDDASKYSDYVIRIKDGVIDNEIK